MVAERLAEPLSIMCTVPATLSNRPMRLFVQFFQTFDQRPNTVVIRFPTVMTRPRYNG